MILFCKQLKEWILFETTLEIREYSEESKDQSNLQKFTNNLPATYTRLFRYGFENEYPHSNKWHENCRLESYQREVFLVTRYQYFRQHVLWVLKSQTTLHIENFETEIYDLKWIRSIKSTTYNDAHIKRERERKRNSKGRERVPQLWETLTIHRYIDARW